MLGNLNSVGDSIKPWGIPSLCVCVCCLDGCRIPGSEVYLLGCECHDLTHHKGSDCVYVFGWGMWRLIGRIRQSVQKLFKVLFKFLLLPDFGFFRTFTISFSFFFVFLLVRTHLEGMIWAFWEDMFYCWLTAGLWISITATWSNLVINKAVSVTFFFFFKLCGVEKPLWIPWLFLIINEKLGNTIPST